MPTYTYQCQACGRTFERVQPITEAPLERCPGCDGPVQRLISAGTGFIMKGRGQGAGRGQRGGAHGCSLERTGQTCCGRSQRCDQPGCGSRP